MNVLEDFDDLYCVAFVLNVAFMSDILTLREKNGVEKKKSDASLHFV